MKTVGIACTGGGTKASSSLGVIKALEELGIKISAISGSSIGSCIAVLYAMGYTVEEILERLKIYSTTFAKLNIEDKIVGPFKLAFRGGAKDPKIIGDAINESAKLKGKTNMCDLEIPIFIPVLDITNKETVYYSSRPIKDEKYYMDRPIEEAVKSTCTLPMLFLPNNVYIDGQLHQFLDGGMTNNTPTIHMDEFVDVVIGVENLYYKKTNEKKVNLVTGVRNTFQSMRRSAVINQKNASDIWIQVDCKEIGVIGNEKAVEKCVDFGYKTAMNILSKDEFRQMLEI